MSYYEIEARERMSQTLLLVVEADSHDEAAENFESLDWLACNIHHETTEELEFVGCEECDEPEAPVISCHVGLGVAYSNGSWRFYEFAYEDMPEHIYADNNLLAAYILPPERMEKWGATEAGKIVKVWVMEKKRPSP